MSYEQDYDHACPKCGHEPIQYRDCTGWNCDDGYADEYEDDPINFRPGESLYKCEECSGTGVEVWCPKCGEDLSGHNFNDEND